MNIFFSDLSFSFLKVQPEGANAWSKRKCGVGFAGSPNRITCPPTSTHTTCKFTPGENYSSPNRITVLAYCTDVHLSLCTTVLNVLHFRTVMLYHIISSVISHCTYHDF